MTKTRRRLTTLFASLLAGASCLAAGAVAPAASAATAQVEITASCSVNKVNFTHTITVAADGSWTQKLRAHNGAATRRHVKIETFLYPTSLYPQGPPMTNDQGVGSFTSKELTLGVGLFKSDTETWTGKGQSAGWVPWFNDLRSGGKTVSLCSTESNWFNPHDLDGINGTQSGTWAPVPRRAGAF